LIGCPIHETLGNRAARSDDKAKGAMIESILGWLSGLAAVAADPRDELQLAPAALQADAAYSRDRFHGSGRAVIARLLERRSNLAEAAVRVLLAGAEREERSAELCHPIRARTIDERLSHQQRIGPMEMRWEVANADGVFDQYADSVVRRIGGLVYVSERERGAARQRISGRCRLDRTIHSSAPAPAAEIQEKKTLP
jgi:uncharacterized tellurite resistance protein B-like protein